MTAGNWEGWGDRQIEREDEGQTENTHTHTHAGLASVEVRGAVLTRRD